MNHSRCFPKVAGFALVVASITSVGGCSTVQEALAPPTFSPTPMATSTWTATPALTPTPTLTRLPTSTFTPTETQTPKNTKTPTPSSTPTSTHTPYPTSTLAPTLTSQQEAQVKQLIEQLKSSDANAAKAAYQKLTFDMIYHYQLCKDDVAALVQIMRAPGAQWEETAGKSGHCTYYSKTSTAAYAAGLVALMGDRDSPYVDVALFEEASDIMKKGDTVVKVTDPGWT